MRVTDLHERNARRTFDGEFDDPQDRLLATFGRGPGWGATDDPPR